MTVNPAVVTVGSIEGGNRSNIISEQGVMLGTVRTFTLEDETTVFNRIRQIAEKTAEAANAEAVVEDGMQKGKGTKTAGPHHTAEFMIDDSSFKQG